MTNRRPPPGETVVIAKPELQAVLDRLRSMGYRTVGPQVADGAVIYDDLHDTAQLPLHQIDVQDGGTYRLQHDPDAGCFDHVVGPHSLKNYLFPPRETLLEVRQVNGRWDMQVPQQDETPLAVIGVRSCDLHALAMQDRIFLGGEHVDPGYRERREQLLLVAVNCRRAAATCFCHSMNTGPAVSLPVDLALTELDDDYVVDIGSERGADVLEAVPWSTCTEDQLQLARELPVELARRMANSQAPAPAETQVEGPRQRHLDTTDIRDLLLGNLEHPRWDEVAERCLSCANCTMVCPTCFCSSVEEVTDLSGEHVTRERTWSSCFMSEHSWMSGGTVRKTTVARYRQWLTHKLASWIDQFGESGCVGCGRCITWCPVGIDLTEEVAAIRGES